MSKNGFASVTVAMFVAIGSAQAADQIKIVGSSTVYPFSTTVAEQFGKTTKFKTPIVESTGSGGGAKLFCAGIGKKYPDITNASRRIKKSEVKRCTKNGIKDIVEVKIGYDGIAMANSRKAPLFKLSRKDIFLALAKDVPNGYGSTKPNPYKTWKEINPALPATKIEVLGPPPTSGTRDAFVELAMEGGCKSWKWIKGIKKASKKAKKAGDKAKAKELKKKYKALCHSIREDGVYIEAGENDNLIVQKLDANPKALGIFGYSFLDQNADKVQGSIIDGKAPTFDNIAQGKYKVSRPLYFYVKKAHLDRVQGIREFVAEFTSDKAWGPEGYLVDKGMIPMSKKERGAWKVKIDSLANLTM